MKRLTDLIVGAASLMLASPVLAAAAVAIWIHDRHAPVYLGERVGKDGRPFRMLKLRSMTPHADRTGVTSTAAGDARVTPVGRFIRRAKLDEFTQLWNVVTGEMSLVGPRPNTWRNGVERYTAAERRLLTVRPGITDFASIVFADEADILRGAADPDARYDALIRPYKSRLGLFYVDHRSLAVDLRLIAYTALALVNRRAALDRTAALLAALGADPELVDVARRCAPLTPAAPPGAEVPSSAVPASV